MVNRLLKRIKTTIITLSGLRVHSYIDSDL